jgi:hypothetical protein
MVEVIVQIILIALVGSFGVPIAMLSLAKLGYFPPITINAYGRRWRVGPKVGDTGVRG